MFFIPIGTNAPIYYRPIGTVLLILANIGCFIMTGGGEGAWTDTFMLEYASGLHPLQWILHSFLHFGPLHLIGNMIFLWIFGLIIEGKIGTFRFLALYLLIGVAGGFIEQVLMLGYDGISQGSGGASLAIFGLMSLALIWAPRNEISFVGVVVFMFIVRTFTFEVTIMTVSGWYLGTNLLFAWLGNFAVSSEMLHLLGAAVGGSIGWGMLKQNWVDCEGWDIVSVWNGKPESQGYFESYMDRQNPAKTDAADRLISTEKRNKTQKLARKFRKLLAEGDLAGALDRRRKLSLLQADDLLTREDLHNLVKQLVADNQTASAIPILEEFLIRFPENSTRHRLKLVELHLKRPYRPREAQQLLTGLSADSLTDTERQHAEKLAQRVNQMIADGVYEIA